MCNKRYDAMYNAQHTELDPAKRAVILDKMQRMLYLQAPYLVTSYGGTGEAYRSDRYSNFTPQPAPDGVYLIQFGPYNYVHIKPINGGGAEAFAALESRNRRAFLYLMCSIALTCLVIGAVVSRYRARTMDDRP
jgi:peptide/nickel transport system substrate-binding protein